MKKLHRYSVGTIIRVGSDFFRISGHLEPKGDRPSYIYDKWRPLNRVWIKYNLSGPITNPECRESSKLEAVVYGVTHFNDAVDIVEEAP